MSLEAFLAAYPSDKIPRQSPDYGKTFVCRRGANTRTATYTEEFVWEDIYQGGQGVHKLIEIAKNDTKATRRPRRVREQSPDDEAYTPKTPTKARTTSTATPQSRRSLATPGSRSVKKYFYAIPIR